jgi:hypothetical protein
MKLHSKPRFLPFALGAILLGGGLLQANAQNKVPVPKTDLRTRTQTRVQSLFKTVGTRASDLNLSAAQKARMQALAQKNAPLIRQIWSNNSLSQAAKIGKVRALESQAQAILTPAQKQKVAAAKGEAVTKMFETAIWVTHELDLTDQQQGQLRAIAMDTYRKTGGSGGNLGALRSLIVDTSGRIDKVLTPAQQSKWAIIKNTARQELVRQTRALRQMNNV